MKKKIVLYIILLFIISTTIFLFFLKNNDVEKDLGGDYFYLPFQEDIFDATTFKGNGIYKIKDNSRIPVIFPKISKYKNDKLYIIIKQKFDSIETRKLLQNMFFMSDVYFKYDNTYVQLDKNYIGNLNFSMSKAESDKYFSKIMNKELRIREMKKNDENYYIIDKIKNRTFGPFNKVEFDKKSKELKITLSFD